MGYTLDQIKAFSSNPGTIAAPGSYGEGKVYNIASILTDLKGLVSAGQVNVKDYFDIAEPLVKSAQSTTQSIAGGGSKKANSVNPAWQQIQDLGAVKSIDGKWQATLPFSAREYASLPESVLPTQKDVNSGLVPLNLLPPIQRFKPDNTPPGPGSVVQPGVPGTPSNPITPGAPGQPGTTPGGGVVLPVTGTQPPVVPPGQPKPTDVNAPQPGVPPAPAAPGASTPTNTVITGTPPVTGVIDPVTGQPIGVPIVGDPLNNSVPKQIDQSVIEQEGLRQQEQDRQAYEAQNALRASKLQDLQKLLTQQDNQQFNVDSPGIYENLNANGLLRSSGLGEALARERSKLSAASDQQIAQQSLSDRDAQVQSIGDILAKTQSFQTSGLERNFTLQDYANEVANAKALGATTAPTIQGGHSVLAGVLGGAASGAATGTAISPGWGTAIGAVGGALAGGGAANASNKGK